ncbi:MAG: carboxymuconolactone decarboxylase family protein [Thermoanaerobaculia bacterium]
MIRHLELSRPAPGSPGAALYRQIRRDFGVEGEPFLLHTPVPELLAGAWAAFRETVIVPGRLSRAAKEVLALAVSEANRCPYCVDAHSATLYALGLGGTARAVARHGQAQNAELRALAAWARASTGAAGATQSPPPCELAAAPEAIGTVLCFHYINRMVEPLLGASPVPPAARLMKGLAFRIFAPTFRRAIGREHRAGESLGFLSPLPEAPASLAWARGSEAIHRAFRGLDAAVASAAEDLLPAASRNRLREHLSLWQGEPAPLGEGWLLPLLAGEPSATAAAGRLALLAARAPYRIDQREVAAFRSHWPEDRALVGGLAWGAYQAAERVSEWLWNPPERWH